MSTSPRAANLSKSGGGGGATTFAETLNANATTFEHKPLYTSTASPSLPREILKWLQTLKLSYPVKIPRRDLATGFTVAEICAIYWADVPMHSFTNQLSVKNKESNWHLLRKLFLANGLIFKNPKSVSPFQHTSEAQMAAVRLAMSREEAEFDALLTAVMNGEGNNAFELIHLLYTVFTGRVVAASGVAAGVPPADLPPALPRPPPFTKNTAEKGGATGSGGGAVPSLLQRNEEAEAAAAAAALSSQSEGAQRSEEQRRKRELFGDLLTSDDNNKSNNNNNNNNAPSPSAAGRTVAKLVRRQAEAIKVAPAGAAEGDAEDEGPSVQFSSVTVRPLPAHLLARFGGGGSGAGGNSGSSATASSNKQQQQQQQQQQGGGGKGGSEESAKRRDVDGIAFLSEIIDTVLSTDLQIDPFAPSAAAAAHQPWHLEAATCPTLFEYLLRHSAVSASTAATAATANVAGGGGSENASTNGGAATDVVDPSSTAAQPLSPTTANNNAAASAAAMPFVASDSVPATTTVIGLVWEALVLRRLPELAAFFIAHPQQITGLLRALLRQRPAAAYSLPAAAPAADATSSASQLPFVSNEVPTLRNVELTMSLLGGSGLTGLVVSGGVGNTSTSAAATAAARMYNPSLPMTVADRLARTNCLLTVLYGVAGDHTRATRRNSSSGGGGGEGGNTNAKDGRNKKKKKQQSNNNNSSNTNPSASAPTSPRGVGGGAAAAEGGALSESDAAAAGRAELLRFLLQSIPHHTFVAMLIAEMLRISPAKTSHLFSSFVVPTIIDTFIVGGGGNNGGNNNNNNSAVTGGTDSTTAASLVPSSVTPRSRGALLGNSHRSAATADGASAADPSSSDDHATLPLCVADSSPFSHVPGGGDLSSGGRRRGLFFVPSPAEVAATEAAAKQLAKARAAGGAKLTTATTASTMGGGRSHTTTTNNNNNNGIHNAADGNSNNKTPLDAINAAHNAAARLTGAAHSASDRDGGSAHPRANTIAAALLGRGPSASGPSTMSSTPHARLTLVAWLASLFAMGTDLCDPAVPIPGVSFPLVTSTPNCAAAGPLFAPSSLDPAATASSIAAASERGAFAEGLSAAMDGGAASAAAAAAGVPFHHPAAVAFRRLQAAHRQRVFSGAAAATARDAGARRILGLFSALQSAVGLGEGGGGGGGGGGSPASPAFLTVITHTVGFLGLAARASEALLPIVRAVLKASAARRLALREARVLQTQITHLTQLQQQQSGGGYGGGQLQQRGGGGVGQQQQQQQTLQQILSLINNRNSGGDGGFTVETVGGGKNKKNHGSNSSSSSSSSLFGELGAVYKVSSSLLFCRPIQLPILRFMFDAAASALLPGGGCGGAGAAMMGAGPGWRSAGGGVSSATALGLLRLCLQHTPMALASAASLCVPSQLTAVLADLQRHRRETAEQQTAGASSSSSSSPSSSHGGGDHTNFHAPSIEPFVAAYGLSVDLTAVTRRVVVDRLGRSGRGSFAGGGGPFAAASGSSLTEWLSAIDVFSAAVGASAVTAAAVSQGVLPLLSATDRSGASTGEGNSINNKSGGGGGGGGDFTDIAPFFVSPSDRTALADAFFYLSSPEFLRVSEAASTTTAKYTTAEKDRCPPAPLPVQAYAAFTAARLLPATSLTLRLFDLAPASAVYNNSSSGGSRINAVDAADATPPKPTTAEDVAFTLFETLDFFDRRDPSLCIFPGARLTHNNTSAAPPATTTTTTPTTATPLLSSRHIAFANGSSSSGGGAQSLVRPFFVSNAPTSNLFATFSEGVGGVGVGGSSGFGLGSLLLPSGCAAPSASSEVNPMAFATALLAANGSGGVGVGASGGVVPSTVQQLQQLLLGGGGGVGGGGFAVPPQRSVRFAANNNTSAAPPSLSATSAGVSAAIPPGAVGGGAVSSSPTAFLFASPAQTAATLLADGAVMDAMAPLLFLCEQVAARAASMSSLSPAAAAPTSSDGGAADASASTAAANRRTSLSATAAAAAAAAPAPNPVAGASSTPAAASSSAATTIPPHVLFLIPMLHSILCAGTTGTTPLPPSFSSSSSPSSASATGGGGIGGAAGGNNNTTTLPSFSSLTAAITAGRLVTASACVANGGVAEGPFMGVQTPLSGAIDALFATSPYQRSRLLLPSSPSSPNHPPASAAAAASLTERWWALMRGALVPAVHWALQAEAAVVGRERAAQQFASRVEAIESQLREATLALASRQRSGGGGTEEEGGQRSAAAAAVAAAALSPTDQQQLIVGLTAALAEAQQQLRQHNAATAAASADANANANANANSTTATSSSSSSATPLLLRQLAAMARAIVLRLFCALSSHHQAAAAAAAAEALETAASDPQKGGAEEKARAAVIAAYNSSVAQQQQQGGKVPAAASLSTPSPAPLTPAAAAVASAVAANVAAEADVRVRALRWWAAVVAGPSPAAYGQL